MDLSEVHVFDLSEVGVVVFVCVFKVFDFSEVILADLSEVSFRPLKRSVFDL